MEVQKLAVVGRSARRFQGILNQFRMDFGGICEHPIWRNFEPLALALRSGYGYEPKFQSALRDGEFTPDTGHQVTNVGN